MEKFILIDDDRRERPLYVSDGLPIGILTNEFRNETYDMINWHWHDEVQFNHVLQGRFLFQIEDKQITVGPGDGIFINSQKIHTARALEDGSSYQFVYFHPGMITYRKDSLFYRKFIGPIIENRNLRYIYLDGTQKDEFDILQMIQILGDISTQKGDCYELDILQGLIRLWKMTYRCCQNKKSLKVTADRIAEDRIKEIISYIHEHAGEKIELKDIADLVRLSRSECSRTFKSYTGQNLFDYINQYRINISIDLLMNTSLPLSDIAYRCGFNSQSYFSTKFRGLKGCSPQEFRTQHKTYISKYSPYEKKRHDKPPGDFIMI